MPIRRLHRGRFVCPQCQARFEAEDADEDELVCEDCGAELEEIEPEEEDEESDKGKP